MSQNLSNRLREALLDAGRMAPAELPADTVDVLRAAFAVDTDVEVAA